MTPRARKPAKPGWVAAALNGLDANKLVALLIAALGALGYADNRGRTATQGVKLDAQVDTLAVRIFARLDSLEVGKANRSALDSLRKDVARLKQRRNPGGSAGVAEASPETVVVEESRPPGAVRRWASGVWEVFRSPFRAGGGR